MDLKQLQALGAFVPGSQIILKQIELKVPPLKPESEWAAPSIPEADMGGVFETKTADFNIKKRSSVDFYELIAAEDRLKPFIAIWRCVCDANGAQLFPTLDFVEHLAPWLWMPLARAVTEVNEFEIKNSRPRTSSGMSLPSSSAAPSRKLNRVSRKKNATDGSPTGTGAAP